MSRSNKISYWKYTKITIETAWLDALSFYGLGGFTFGKILKPLLIWALFFLLLYQLSDKGIVKEEFRVSSIGVVSFLFAFVLIFIVFLDKANHKLYDKKLEEVFLISS